MKLDAVNGIPAMTDPHHLPRLPGIIRPGADFEIIVHLVGPHDQAVIPRGNERVSERCEDPFRIVVNLRDLSVHQPVGPIHFPTEDLTDALVTQAHSQQGHFRPEPLDDLFRNARFARSAWSGRDDDSIGTQGRDFVERNLIISDDAHVKRGIDLTQSLHEVVGERVVVVDQQDHSLTIAQLREYFH